MGRNTTSIIVVCALAAYLFSGCTGGAQQGMAQATQLRIQVPPPAEVQAMLAASSARSDGGSLGTSVHALSTVPSPVQVRVSARGDFGIVQQVVPVGQETATLLVPQGVARLISLEYLDFVGGTEELLGGGSVTVDLLQPSATVTIPIGPGLPGISTTIALSPPTVGPGAPFSGVIQVNNQSGQDILITDGGIRFRDQATGTDRFNDFAPQTNGIPAGGLSVPNGTQQSFTVSGNVVASPSFQVPSNFTVDGIVRGSAVSGRLFASRQSQPSGTTSVGNVPVITSLFPSSANVSGNQLVDIKGVNLSGATSVTIGGMLASSVTVVSSTQVTVRTPPRTAGPTTVTITTGLGTSAPFTGFSYVSCSGAPVCFNLPPSVLTVSSGNFSSVAIADFNAAVDTQPDLLLGDLGTGQVHYFQNNAGSFPPIPTSFPVVGVKSIAVGDVTQDSKNDIVVGGPASITLLTGNANGGAAPSLIPPPTPPPTVPPTTLGVAIARLDSDTTNDFLASAEGGFPRVDSYLNNMGGGGAFTAIANNPGGGNPGFLKVADLDGDAKADAVVATPGSNLILLMTGDGVGGFSPNSPLGVGGAISDLVLADFNSDGRPDIAVVAAGKIEIRLNTGALVFNTPSGSPISPPGGFMFTSISAVDLDFDGTIDLISGESSTTSQMGFLQGNGNGTFATDIVILPALSGPPNRVIAADLDQDGKPDVVSANSTGTVDVALQL